MGSQRSTCLCLPSAGIKGFCHCCPSAFVQLLVVGEAESLDFFYFNLFLALFPSYWSDLFSMDMRAFALFYCIQLLSLKGLFSSEVETKGRGSREVGELGKTERSEDMGNCALDVIMREECFQWIE